MLGRNTDARVADRKHDRASIFGKLRRNPNLAAGKVEIFAEKLKADAQPTSSVAQALSLRKLLATANPVGAEQSVQQWMSHDPARLVDCKTRILGKLGDDRFTGLATAGEMKVRVTLEKSTGMPLAAEMDMGPQKITVDRIYLKGSF